MSYETAKEKLQDVLLNTFLSNLSFLQNYDRELYLKVDELSKMINEGVYEEKYSLEFLEDQGEFDIYDLKNDKYLYNKKPKRWNDEIVRKYNLDDENSILTLESELYSGKIYNDIVEDKYQLQNIIQSSKRTINNISEIVNVLVEKKDKNKRLKKIPKTIFLGTLLGRHISRIINKHDSDLYLVVEKNLEIFRLSLFVLDLTLFMKKSGVIFSIMEDEFTYERKVIEFLQINPFDNYLIKLCTTDINIQSYLDNTLSAVLNTKPSSFDYNRILYNFTRNISEKISSAYNILELNKLKKSFTFLSDKPVLYIAAGPSLNENIDWIKKVQNSFFIVTVGAAVKKLVDNDIKIDMIFTLDPQAWVIKEKQFPDEIIPKLKDTIIMASIITYQGALDKFNQKNLYIYEVFKPFLEDNIVLDVSSVGELGLGMLINMNVKELYLIGLDFALNKNTSETHSEGTSNIKKYNTSNSSSEVVSERIIFGLRNRTFDVKGNFEEKVKTTGLFSSSIYHINIMLENKKIDLNIYNLSEHGAYFNNTIPKKVEEVKVDEVFEKDSFRNLIKENLELFSIKSLSIERIEFIKKEIEYLEKIQSIDFDILKNYEFHNYEEFFLLVKELLIKIISFNSKNDILTMLINNHTQIIFNYLNYIFNDTKIKKETKKIEKIKIIYLRQLKELIEDYTLFIKNITK